MKFSRAEVRGKATAISELRFEDQTLTSFAGLVIFQKFFLQFGLKERLRRCFSHLKVSPIYAHHMLVMLLVVHLLLGYRQLRDSRYYQNDEMVKRLVGLKRLPDVATISRGLARADELSVEKLRAENLKTVTDRLSALGLARVTLDFDGSVQSSARHAEGTAVGYNRKKKGQRSYYPLFCTIAQTDQVLDLYHRPGNVHDSNGAKAFILQCIDAVRWALPQARIEVRIDSAFFNEHIAKALSGQGVKFTISVPFERFTELKSLIQARKRWRRINQELSYFEAQWKPKSWRARCRFLFIRKKVKRQYKAPLQLDLFIPHHYDYEFKVIVTNKMLSARKVVAFHEGRGSQEGVFAELKSDCQMGYIPVTTRVGNQLYLLSALLAHNLNRELQMQVQPITRRTTEKRAALWKFQELNTLRRNLLQRAGRIIRPKGKVTLSMSDNPTVKTELLHYLTALDQAA